MVYLPNEIKDLIINMSYKLMYEDVLNEFRNYVNEFDFLFPFRHVLIYTIDTLIYVDSREDLAEVIFEDDLELYYIN